MKHHLIAAALAAALTATPVATAQGWYVDGGYSFIGIDVEDGGVSADVDLGALAGHIGYDFNDMFGVEGEVLVGVADEDFSDGVFSGNLELNSALGVFAKAQLPVNEQFSIFGRAGLVNAELEATLEGFGSESASDTGVGYGIGAIANLQNNLYIRGDYTRYDIEDLEADAFMVGLGLRF